jgi:hypothetical protein
VSRRTGALLALAVLLAGCGASATDPGWRRQTSRGCRQQYGARGSTSESRPELIFFCVESP